VHQYIGGIEHAVLHLLYARFFARALSDCAVMNLREPFAGLMTQGMVCHATFKDASGNWVYPSDVATNAQGNLALSDGTAVKQGRSEKMSKSKKNTVDPRQMIEAYGADTARLFMMSDSPPDRDLEWTDGGIEGAWRYVQRFYRLAQRASKAPRAANAHMPPSDCIRLMHKTIHHVTHDVEQFHFNKAVARIREFTNALEKCNDDAPELHACMVIATQLIAPFMPHLAEECWGMLGGTGLVCEAAWPKENPEFLVENTVTIAVQINGKLRATIDMPPDAPRELMEKAALEAPKIQEFLGDATLKKVIVVPGKIVNLVAA
jgi:leucyl-tRNA synthetase